MWNRLKRRLVKRLSFHFQFMMKFEFFKVEEVISKYKDQLLKERYQFNFGRLYGKQNFNLNNSFEVF